MFVFTRIPDESKILEKGQWRPFVATAVCCCPKCGNIARLGHEIASDGIVTPSLVCPFDGCDFHEMVKLENWK